MSDRIIIAGSGKVVVELNQYLRAAHPDIILSHIPSWNAATPSVIKECILSLNQDKLYFINCDECTELSPAHLIERNVMTVLNQLDTIRLWYPAVSYISLCDGYDYGPSPLSTSQRMVHLMMICYRENYGITCEIEILARGFAQIIGRLLGGAVDTFTQSNDN